MQQNDPIDCNKTNVIKYAQKIFWNKLNKVDG